MSKFHSRPHEHCCIKGLPFRVSHCINIEQSPGYTLYPIPLSHLHSTEQSILPAEIHTSYIRPPYTAADAIKRLHVTNNFKKPAHEKKGPYGFQVCGFSNVHAQSMRSACVLCLMLSQGLYYMSANSKGWFFKCACTVPYAQCMRFFFFALSFLKVSTICLRTAKAQASLRLCAGSPEPSLVAYVTSTIFSCAGLNIVFIAPAEIF